MTLDEYLSRHEDVDLEVKKAQGQDGDGEVPRSFWESYSAMANTDGGIIILGARERSDGRIELIGIRAIAKVRKALWDGLNDRKQISVNLLNNDDVRIVEQAGRQVVVVTIPRASRIQRPVFIGQNPLTGTFRRRFEGDYRCDEASVKRMLAEATEESRDFRILSGFDLEDIDSESLAAYRNEFRSTKPGHPWLGLDDQELLRNLGGWARDRESGQEGLTIAGLLMFGKLRPILDGIPNYLVDYQERPASRQDVRWIDRVTTDGTWSGNLFDFYRRTYAKLTQDLKVPFRLEHGVKRVDESHVHEALREALVNALIHADYGGTIGILVLKEAHQFAFRNPGDLRLPARLVLAGGMSDCRNRNLQKMFQLIGVSEQAGSGFPKILRAWREQQWRAPLLSEDVETEHTTLRMPMISLLPQETIDELDKRFGLGFRRLNEIERLALATALIEGEVSNERLREMCSLHSRDITTLLHNLVDRGFLHQYGTGRGTRYRLPGTTASPGDLTLFSQLEFVHSEPGSVHLTGGSEHLAEGSEHLAEGSEQLSEPSTLLSIVRSRPKVPVKMMEDAILLACRDRFLTVGEIAEVLQRAPDTIRVHYLTRLVRAGLLVLRYPDKPNHPEQAYKASQRPAEL
ncbi:MAG TPA: RNA-binding domain-containing protein [Ktedonobacterales bacterium]